jgi:hypothetical protein
MSRRLLIVAAAAICAGSAMGTASAAEYLFVFEPVDAHFAPERADNRSSLAATLSLLQDYAGAEGVHFVLAGDLPAECVAAADCEARSLQKRRVDSIKAEIAALPDGARWSAQLQWQATPSASEGTHVEGLQLRLRLDPPSVFSGECPYQLQVTDPRLPAELSAAGAEPKAWVSVRGLDAIPISGAASMRATAAVRNSGTVTATQRLNDHDALLSSGSTQAEWSAGQLDWHADAADVDIGSASQPRDIGNVILPWDENPASLPTAGTNSGAAFATCRVHFVLRR